MPVWLQTTLWIVGALAVVFVVGGLMLPRAFEISRSIVVNAPPEKIHPHVDSFAKWREWSPFDTEDPNIVWGPVTQDSGVGARRSWKSKKMGNGEQWITASDPKKGVSMKLSPIDGCKMDPFDVDLMFTPEAGGTRVTWRDRGVLPAGPHWRWMGNLLLDRMLGKMFEKGLAALKANVEMS